jgi:hypothetical protein
MPFDAHLKSVVCAIASLTLTAFFPAPADAQLIPKLPAGAAGAAKKLDMTHVPADAVAAIVVQPKRVLGGPMGAPLAPMLSQSFGKKQLGFEIADIEQAMLVIGLSEKPQNASSRDHVALVLRFAKPVDLDMTVSKIVPGWQQGKTASGEESPFLKQMNLSCLVVDDRTLMFGEQASLTWALVAKAGASSLRNLMATATDAPELQAFVAVEPLRAMINQDAAAAFKQTPPELIRFTKLPNLIDSITASTVVTEKGGLEFKATANTPNEQAAQEVETDIKQLLDMGRAVVAAQTGNAKGGAADFKSLSDKVLAAL